MNESLMTIIAIALAAILIFVFPLMTTSENTDKASQLAVKEATTEFVNKATTKGKIDKADYDMFVQTITATGNTYEVELSIQVKDTNLAKKKSLAQSDKTGENVYYTVFNSQIMPELNGANHAYYCKEGDIISVHVKNTNQTIAQQLKNFFYTVTNNSTYTIAAEYTGMVTANGK